MYKEIFIAHAQAGKISINLNITFPKKYLSLIFFKAEPYSDSQFDVICSRGFKTFYKKGPWIKGAEGRGVEGEVTKWVGVMLI